FPWMGNAILIVNAAPLYFAITTLKKQISNSPAHIRQHSINASLFRLNIAKATMINRALLLKNQARLAPIHTVVNRLSVMYAVCYTAQAGIRVGKSKQHHLGMVPTRHAHNIK